MGMTRNRIFNVRPSTDQIDAAGAVMESDFDPNTIIAADSDNTPTARTVAEQRLVGRITGGNIAALTPAQIASAFGWTAKVPSGYPLWAQGVPGLSWPAVSGAVGLTANRVYVVPLILPHEYSITDINCIITTLEAAKFLRLALYDSGTANGYLPVNLIAESGNISIATTGVKTFTTAQTIGPGVYHLSLSTDATGTAEWSQSAFFGGGYYSGATPITDTPNVMAYDPSAFGAFPDPIGALTLTGFDSLAVTMWVTVA